MCGIIGYFQNENKENPHFNTNSLFDAIMQFRRKGTDGVGALILFNNGSHHVIRSHSSQADFIMEHGKELKFLTESKCVSAIIIHNRWATHGDVNLNGVHPFTGQRYILMHNGSFEPSYVPSIPSWEYKANSDSERMCAYLNRKTAPKTPDKNIQDLINRVGVNIGILVIYDTETGKLYLYRDISRQLCYQKKDGNIARFFNDTALGTHFVTGGVTVHASDELHEINPIDGSVTRTWKIKKPIYSYSNKGWDSNNKYTGNAQGSANRYPAPSFSAYREANVPAKESIIGKHFGTADMPFAGDSEFALFNHSYDNDEFGRPEPIQHPARGPFIDDPEDCIMEDD